MTTMPEQDSSGLQSALEKIENRNHKIGIIGLGYVGLPLSLAAAKSGFNVLGFDINPKRVGILNQGNTGLRHIPDEDLTAAVQTKRFEATIEFSRLAECDSILIAVPTPLTKNREPDLSYVEDTAEKVSETLRAGQLIVLESTTWPGTTLEVVKPILEQGGMKSGTDFFLAFSPEREDPANATHNTTTIPKVVGADGPFALAVATKLYDSFLQETVPVSTPSTAEAVKITENIFRAVNIALVNELKVIFDEMDIDIWEVIDAAKTKPFGFMPFYPGPGLGGHCIPIDPFYLTWKAREYGINTRFIELAGEINTSMPSHVVAKLAEQLDHQSGRGLNGSKILLVGMAYKKNVDDIRESPSLYLIELLEKRGAKVDYHDPHVPAIPPSRDHPNLTNRASVAIDAKSLSEYDAVLIATDHDIIDWPALAKHAKLIVDTRNVFAKANITQPNIFKA